MRSPMISTLLKKCWTPIAGRGEQRPIVGRWLSLPCKLAWTILCLHDRLLRPFLEGQGNLWEASGSRKVLEDGSLSVEKDYRGSGVARGEGSRSVLLER